MLEETQIIVDGSPMKLLVATPQGSERRPGILLSHYQHGLGPFTRRNAERLASEGFIVVAPDHYHHTPGEPDLTKRKLGLIDTRLIADMMAATSYLRAHPRTLPHLTAIMGHCMGGRQALLGAAMIPGFRCAIDCYGGGVLKALGPGPTVFERFSSITCPVAGFFGVDDTNPPPADVRQIEAELIRLGIETSFHIYPNTGHAFMDPDQKRYVETSSNDAWIKILDFLRRHLAYN